jgi:hypothetical protein
VDGPGNHIGGGAPGARNVISGNGVHGIEVDGMFSKYIDGNLIGTDISGTQPLANALDGIYIRGSRTSLGSNNVIGFNGRNGVTVDGGGVNHIFQNLIFAHDNGLGIDLINGGNGNTMYPVISSATSSTDLTTITGTITTERPYIIFTVEFFSNSVCNPTGFGEGESYLGEVTLSTDANGVAHFTVNLDVAVPAGQFVTATATNPRGNTSEFSACVVVTGRAGSPLSVGVLGTSHRVDVRFRPEPSTRVSIEQVSPNHWESNLTSQHPLRSVPSDSPLRSVRKAINVGKPTNVESLHSRLEFLENASLTPECLILM